MKKRYWITSFAAMVTAAGAAKLLTRPEDVDWDRNRATVFHSEHSHFVEVDGVRVHYQEAGHKTAPPLVLIHGFASSTLVWSKVFLQLAEIGFRVIVPDLLGYGYSGKPRDREYTIEAQARLIVGLLDRLGLDRACVVGSSYGGWIGATCALGHPQSGDKIILLGAGKNKQPLRFLVMR